MSDLTNIDIFLLVIQIVQTLVIMCIAPPWSVRGQAMHGKIGLVLPELVAVRWAEPRLDSFTVPHTVHALRRLHATGLDGVARLVVGLFGCSLERLEIFVLVKDRSRWRWQPSINGSWSGLKSTECRPDLVLQAVMLMQDVNFSSEGSVYYLATADRVSMFVEVG